MSSFLTAHERPSISYNLPLGLSVLCATYGRVRRHNGIEQGGTLNKGSIVVAVLQRSDRLEPRYKLSTLRF